MRRKFLTGVLFMALLSAGFVSCGDDDPTPAEQEQENVTPENPDGTEDPNKNPEQGNENDQKPEDKPQEPEKPKTVETPIPDIYLKDMIDREKHPNFLLACGVAVGNITNNSSMQSKLIPPNYDEISPENCMKYSSVVNWNGQINTNNVKNFVNAAKSKGLRAYGHTLAWHSQQQPKYLLSLMEGKETDEEKKQAIIDELDRWIGAMMEATDGYVYAWDAINEAISGADNDRDGKYDLQGYNQTADHNFNVEGENFFWQHWLGHENYGPIVINLARKHFKGNPEDLKLFINDYNLESFWDDNAKAKSMVKWIEVWENNGCKIDGIGTQMHINCYENANNEKTSREHITKMFEILAASGKLVRISELDMGFVKGSNIWGGGSQYSQLNYKQKKMMADKYEFIYKEYFRIIPPEQQYGICQWAIADSPYGWRGGEPLGLWSNTWKAKPAFLGVLRGLCEDEEKMKELEWLDGWDN